MAPHALRVERNIWLPTAGEQQTAQLLITNQVDAGTGMQPATFPTVFRQNPKIMTSHSGQKPPFGYVRLVAGRAVRQQRTALPSTTRTCAGR